MSQSIAPRVLVVDDDPDLLLLISKVLKQDHYEVSTAQDAGAALNLAAEAPRPDLILLDVEMPGATGFDVCRVLKADSATADIPVIFLTGRSQPAEEIEGLDIGAVDYLTKPINSKLLRVRVRIHLALANRRAELERLVTERTQQLERTRLQLIRRLARAMEYHESTAVGNRVARVAQYVKLLAEAAGAKPSLCDMMLNAAPLYDIGKLAVPAEVLRKPTQLSAPDWERVRQHPELGAEIIGEHADPMLNLARMLALTHHECWDGSGYPGGLKGEAIPWPGRVMAIADAFEAMTTTQFHRDPKTIDEAAAEIERQAGSKFDPALVAPFRHALPAMRAVRERYADSLGDLINLDFSAPARK